MYIALIITTGIICLLCFLCGFKCGKSEQIISDKTKQNLLHPIETIENNKIDKETKRKDRIAAIQDEVVLSNIDTYTGFGSNQKDIPYYQEEGDEL